MCEPDFASIHQSVLLEQAIADLAPSRGGLYLDGTLGLGGHAEAVLQSSPQAQVCGLDQDGEALALAGRRLSRFGNRAHLFQMRFADFPLALGEMGWKALDGCLLDLGVSSLQLDSPERGFSFRAAGPLDMRMDKDSGAISAAQLVNRASHAELRDCIATLGEDPQAGRIAKRIIEERQKQPISDTLRLAEIVRLAYPPKWRRCARRHPATRVFQALRMRVNGELEQLERFLAEIPGWMAPNGRVVIISFHSLEDRLAKRAMRAWAQAEPPMAAILHKKPIGPDQEEMARNPRSASAHLRAAEMTGNDYTQ